MTAADVARLLSAVSTQHVYAFFLVLARVSPLFVVAPVFSSSMLLPRVRSVLAVGIALGLTPLVDHGRTVPSGVLPLVGLMLENFLVGLALAYSLACVFAAISSAGVLADAFGGFSFGSQIDPINGNPGGSLTNLYTTVGLATFLVIGGDAWTVRGLNATFSAVPITSSAPTRSLMAGAISAFASMLVGAIEIAAPVMLAILVTDIAFGMLSKVVPQISVFSVGFTVKVGVSLLIVGVSLPFVGNWMSTELYGAMGSVVQSMRAA
jgi:flagellar biosynthetic protein FliR